MLIATSLRPISPGSNEADARIVLFLAHPKAFDKLPEGVRSEPGAAVDGKPSLRLTPARDDDHRKVDAKGMWGMSERFVEGYRLEAHNLYFFLLLESADPIERSRATLREMATGIRWTKPVPAHEALAMSGQLTRVWHDADLWFDVPYPFWNNPFRGSFYQPEALLEETSGNTYFEVHELEGARDLVAARQAAVEAQMYYGTHGWDLAWRQRSRDPEVHVGATTPTAPDREGNVRLVKMIVARAPDGRYFRIAFSISEAADAVKRYDALVDDVARSVSVVAPPVVPRLSTDADSVVTASLPARSRHP